jgi:MFS family permease
MSIAIRRRLTWLLFFGQSLGSAGFLAGGTVGSILGQELSGDTRLAGVPGALYLLGNAAGAYPAARLMERTGRRLGLTLGFAIGIGGALLAGYAVLVRSFAVFLGGMALMGVSRGFTDLGRYAAAEMHPMEERARAISLVVLGGTVGAIVGPALVAPMGRLAEFFQRDPLSGPWFASAALFLIGVVLMGLFLRPDPASLGRALADSPAQADAAGGPVRPMRQIVGQPGTQVALAAMVLGQLVMVMIMAVTSLHVYATHSAAPDHGVGAVSLVITAHTLGMFGLSVVVGRFADNFGRTPAIVGGALILMVACLLAPLSQNTYLLAAALFLLGLGWNACYVAGAALLTDTLTLAERGRVQGSSDLLVATVSALGNLTSGVVFAALGYATMTWLSLAVTLVPLTLAARLVVSQYRRRGAEELAA